MRGRLKLATKADLVDAGGPTDLHAEKYVRVGPAALSRASVHTPENDDHFVGIDTALDLDLLAGEPRHARALAEAQNYSLVPNAAVAPGSRIDHPGLNRLSRVLNDVEMVMREALEDGDVSAAEASEALAMVTKAEEELARKRAKLLAIVRRESGE